MPDNKFDFEKSLLELEKIISKLENGETTLEDSIALFEKGIKYTNDCKEALEKAEKKILSLTDAERQAEDFD